MTAPHLQAGTPEYRRALIGLFIGGYITFAILYATQSLLPVLSRQYGVSAVKASLTMSLATGTLAFSLVIAGSLSEAWGRKRMMNVSLVAASVIMILTGFSPSFSSMLWLRFIQGIVIAGLPSVAMAYLVEEIDARSVGGAMGMLIAGNSLGGMSGRILTSAVTDWVSWRVALSGIGLIALAGSLWFIARLPASRNFRSRPLRFRSLGYSLLQHLRDPGLWCLFGIAFMLQNAFTALYTYITYRLEGAPYHLSEAVMGLIYLNYLPGAFSSTWMGRQADRYGRQKIMWLGLAIMALGAGLTLLPPLACQIAGTGIFTVGFFGCHSIASSWVGRRAASNKAQASSLYLLFYYLGVSVGGTLGGAAWTAWNWRGVIGLNAASMLGMAFLIGCLGLLPTPAAGVGQAAEKAAG
jgi:MFS transporter, YNFM family, putative membrane transport protein